MKAARGRREPTGDDADFTYYRLVVPIGAVLALYSVASFVPHRAVWGLSGWQSAPAWFPIAAIVLFALLCTPPTLKFFSRQLAQIERLCRDACDRIPRWVWVSLVSLLALVVFTLFRSKALVYGDGYLVAAAADESLADPLTGDELLKPLSVYLYRAVAMLAYRFVVPDIAAWLAAATAVGGVVGFWGLARVAHLLADRDSMIRFIYLLIALSSGSTLLFFGHVEHYTWGMAACLWQIGSMMRHVRGEEGTTGMLVWGAVASGFHALYLPLLVLSLLLLSRKQDVSDGLRLPLGVTWRRLAWLIVGLSIAAAIVVQLAGMRRVAVQVWPTEGNPYWVLSGAHFLDVANLLLLVAPLGLALGIAAWRKGTMPTQSSDPVMSLLAVVVTITLLESFWVEPVLGAPRDWDLLAVCGFPMSFLGAYLFTRLVPLKRRAAFGVLCLGAMLLLVVPAVIEGRSLHRTAVRLDRHLWTDPHYQIDYDGANRSVHWGAILHDKAAEDSLAVKYFRRRLEAKPKDDLAWENLGAIYEKAGIYDSAAQCYSAALETLSLSLYYIANLARAEQKLGHRSTVETLMQELESSSLLEARTARTAGMVREDYRQYQAALGHYRRAFELDPQAWEQWRNLGFVHAKLGQMDSALYYLEPTLAASPREEKAAVYGAVIGAKALAGDFVGAQQTLEKYREEFPTAIDLLDLQMKINAARQRKAEPDSQP